MYIRSVYYLFINVLSAAPPPLPFSLSLANMYPGEFYRALIYALARRLWSIVKSTDEESPASNIPEPASMIAPHPDDARNYPIDMCWSRKGIKGRRAGARARIIVRLLDSQEASFSRALPTAGKKEQRARAETTRHANAARRGASVVEKAAYFIDRRRSIRKKTKRVEYVSSFAATSTSFPSANLTRNKEKGKAPHDVKSQKIALRRLVAANLRLSCLYT